MKRERERERNEEGKREESEERSSRLEPQKGFKVSFPEKTE